MRPPEFIVALQRLQQTIRVVFRKLIFVPVFGVFVNQTVYAAILFVAQFAVKCVTGAMRLLDKGKYLIRWCLRRHKYIMLNDEIIRSEERRVGNGLIAGRRGV